MPNLRSGVASWHHPHRRCRSKAVAAVTACSGGLVIDPILMAAEALLAIGGWSARVNVMAAAAAVHVLRYLVQAG